MKQIILLILVGFGIFILACSGPKEVSESSEKSVEVSADDSVEYDVETFNSHFDTWYQRQDTPATYRSLQFYENWNRQYVSAWNAKCASGARNWSFEPVVGYDATEEYGFEMNHKLFYYFMYVEKVMKIKIIPSGPNIIVH